MRQKLKEEMNYIRNENRRKLEELNKIFSFYVGIIWKCFTGAFGIDLYRWNWFGIKSVVPINPDLWDIDDTSADIFVENGRVRFNHNTAEEGDSSWLIFRKRPENIKAVKVRVKIVQGASGDSRARIGGWVGKEMRTIPYGNNFKLETNLTESTVGRVP